MKSSGSEPLGTFETTLASCIRLELWEFPTPWYAEQVGSWYLCQVCGMWLMAEPLAEHLHTSLSNNDLQSLSNIASWHLLARSRVEGDCIRSPTEIRSTLSQDLTEIIYIYVSHYLINSLFLASSYAFVFAFFPA